MLVKAVIVGLGYIGSKLMKHANICAKYGMYKAKFRTYSDSGDEKWEVHSMNEEAVAAWNEQP